MRARTPGSRCQCRSADHKHVGWCTNLVWGHNKAGHLYRFCDECRVKDTGGQPQPYAHLTEDDMEELQRMGRIRDLAAPLKPKPREEDEDADSDTLGGEDLTPEVSPSQP